MIISGWRRIGVGPFAIVFVGLAVVALLLSRGAGSGWLVVVAAGYLGVVIAALGWSVAGLVGLRVDLAAPTDAVVGETFAVDVTIRGATRQLRTVRFVNVDDSVHPVDGATRTRVHVHAAHRSYLPTLAVEVRGGLPLGLFRFARTKRIELPVPLAIAPVPAVVSLLDALGEDAAAEVRSVRSYVPGDPARLVHWRSTARRGELMVRELESAELLRGAALVIRVSLPDDNDRAEATASEAAGLVLAALDAGVRVRLLTVDAEAARDARVTTRRDVGRRLAAAVPGEPMAADGDDDTHVVELPR